LQDSEDYKVHQRHDFPPDISPRNLMNWKNHLGNLEEGWVPPYFSSVRDAAWGEKIPM
jgi:hypothetical protein